MIPLTVVTNAEFGRFKDSSGWNSLMMVRHHRDHLASLLYDYDCEGLVERMIQRWDSGQAYGELKRGMTNHGEYPAVEKLDVFESLCARVGELERKHVVDPILIPEAA